MPYTAVCLSYFSKHLSIRKRSNSHHGPLDDQRRVAVESRISEPIQAPQRAGEMSDGRPRGHPQGPYSDQRRRRPTWTLTRPRSARSLPNRWGAGTRRPSPPCWNASAPRCCSPPIKQGSW